MPAWSPTLPCYPLDGSFTETPQPNVAAFQPEIGPAKFRRRSTANGTRASLQWKMSKGQYLEFVAFFETDLKDGSLPFRMKHPITDTLYDWQFESPPEIASQQRNCHLVSAQLRRMTT